MRHSTYTVFDEFLPVATSTFTDAQFNSRLAVTDQIALHAVADNVTVGGTPTCSIFVQHSSDGRNFLYRSNNSVTAPGTPEIQIPISTGVPIHLMWSDSCLGTTSAGPLLSFVRLAIVMGAGTACHLKIHVTHRDGSR